MLYFFATDVMSKCFENITNIENKYYTHIADISMCTYSVIKTYPKYVIVGADVN